MWMDTETIYKRYHFHIHSTDDMALLKDLERHFPGKHCEVVQEYGKLSAYLVEEQEYGDGISFYVSPPRDNRSQLHASDKPNTGYVYSFKSREEYNRLMLIIQEKEQKLDKQLDKQYPIYRFTAEGKYQRKEKYYPRPKETLLGLEMPFGDIMTQIDAHTDHRSFLASIGENGRSLNYLLYGPPGTGKSSFVTSIATELQYPIYVVNPSTLAPQHLQAALSPQGGSSSTKLLLYEDIDRYLGTSSVTLSQLLNSLDGMDDSDNVIRFFTANDEQVLREIPALASRFTATYHFALPTKEILCTKVDKMMQYYGPEWKQRMNCHGEMEALCDRAVQSHLSFRDLTNYVIRFLFPPLSSSSSSNSHNHSEKTDYQPLQKCLDEKEWNQMMNLHAERGPIVPSSKLKRRRRVSSSSVTTDNASEEEDEDNDEDDATYTG